MSSSLAPDIERFVREYIDSVEQLEILVLLRLHRDRAFTASELATEMRTSEGSASTRLRSLVGSGLVHQLASPSGATSFQYSPKDPALDARVASVATAYVTRRYAVIDAIFAKPTDKIRLFGEAFRLRKNEDDDG
jgi:predicted transcriptional regulator